MHVCVNARMLRISENISHSTLEAENRCARGITFLRRRAYLALPNAHPCACIEPARTEVFKHGNTEARYKLNQCRELNKRAHTTRHFQEKSHIVVASYAAVLVLLLPSMNVAASYSTWCH